MERPKSRDNSANNYRTTCNRDCPDSCAIIATVKDGRIIRHRGDPEHPVTRGFLCSRGNDYLKRFYDPDRLLHPMRRTEKGWQRLSWDEALDLIAEKLRYYRDTFGPRSVLVVNYNPSLWKGDLNGVNQLREAMLTDIGSGAAMHQIMVSLKAYDPDAEEES